MKKLVYLAIPYTWNKKVSFEIANKVSAILMESGYNVFSPISHSHNIDYYISIKTDFNFWMEQDLCILDKCDKLVVVRINGAYGDELIKNSPGCQKEINLAKKLNLPIETLDYHCKICKSDDKNVRDYNVGKSDYSNYKIQPWDIWLEYGLNPWDADVVKRILRKKEGEDRKTDYEKIIHICKERIRQLNEKS